MHEILQELPAGSRVLDLGCRDGSFRYSDYDFLTVSVDLNPPPTPQPNFVRADAAHLPFRTAAFHAVILNHSLEHIVEMKPALQELGRVVDRHGAAYVAVPDATTFTDRLYRRLFRDAGGHVNLFGSADELEATLSWYLGLRVVARRTLYSSLSFLNRRNYRDRSVRRQVRLPPLGERWVSLMVAITRGIDRWFGTRSSVYGWAFYLGSLRETVSSAGCVNVCIRCGTGLPIEILLGSGQVKRILGFRRYACPACGARNYFFSDVERGRPKGQLQAKGRMPDPG